MYMTITVLNLSVFLIGLRTKIFFKSAEPVRPCLHSTRMLFQKLKFSKDCVFIENGTKALSIKGLHDRFGCRVTDEKRTTTTQQVCKITRLIVFKILFSAPRRHFFNSSSFKVLRFQKFPPWTPLSKYFFFDGLYPCRRNNVKTQLENVPFNPFAKKQNRLTF